MRQNPLDRWIGPGAVREGARVGRDCGPPPSLTATPTSLPWDLSFSRSAAQQPRWRPETRRARGRQIRAAPAAARRSRVRCTWWQGVGERACQGACMWGGCLCLQGHVCLRQLPALSSSACGKPCTGRPGKLRESGGCWRRIRWDLAVWHQKSALEAPPPLFLYSTVPPPPPFPRRPSAREDKKAPAVRVCVRVRV